MDYFLFEKCLARAVVNTELRQRQPEDFIGALVWSGLYHAFVTSVPSVNCSRKIVGGVLIVLLCQERGCAGMFWDSIRSSKGDKITTCLASWTFCLVMVVYCANQGFVQLTFVMSECSKGKLRFPDSRFLHQFHSLCSDGSHRICGLSRKQPRGSVRY